MSVLQPLAEAYRYVPFVTPLPVWNYWWVLVFPLCIGIAVVYKSVRCATMKRVPWEATVITFWMLLAMVSVAVFLSLLVRALER